MGTTSSFLNQFVHSQIPSPPPAIAQGAKVEVATKLSKSNRSPGVQVVSILGALRKLRKLRSKISLRGEKRVDKWLETGDLSHETWWKIRIYSWNMMETWGFSREVGKMVI